MNTPGLPDPVPGGVGADVGGAAAMTTAVAARGDEIGQGEVGELAGRRLAAPGPGPPVAARRCPLPLRLGRERFTVLLAEVFGPRPVDHVRRLFGFTLVSQPLIGDLRRF